LLIASGDKDDRGRRRLAPATTTAALAGTAFTTAIAAEVGAHTALAPAHILARACINHGIERIKTAVIATTPAAPQLTFRDRRRGAELRSTYAHQEYI
jgi:hypothetical protein